MLGNGGIRTHDENFRHELINYAVRIAERYHSTGNLTVPGRALEKPESPTTEPGVSECRCKDYGCADITDKREFL